MMSDINRFRGDTYPIKYQLNDELNQPIDITGNTFIFSVGREENPPTANYVFQVTGTITGASTGEFEFNMTANADYVDTFFYDVVQISGGLERTLVKGKLTYKQDIGK